MRYIKVFFGARMGPNFMVPNGLRRPWLLLWIAGWALVVRLLVGIPSSKAVHLLRPRPSTLVNSRAGVATQPAVLRFSGHPGPRRRSKQRDGPGGRDPSQPRRSSDERPSGSDFHTLLLWTKSAALIIAAWLALTRWVYRRRRMDRRSRGALVACAAAADAQEPATLARTLGVPILVSGAFDSGSIGLSHAVGDSIDVCLQPDPFCGLEGTAHMQWFHFQVSNVRGRPITVNVLNAWEASFPTAWEGTRVCYSYDREDWRRVATTKYDTELGMLTWSLSPERDTVWFAHFAPHTYERHLALVAKAAARGAEVSAIGCSLESRPIDLLRLGTGPLRVWVTARQHPGETMGSWMVEGLLGRLQDGSPASEDLLSCATFLVLPNLNPDGTVRGHFRSNAAGCNLNREWGNTGDYLAPSLERSPEVYHTLKAMDTIGCDLLIDLHGDGENTDNAFMDTCGIPGWSPRLQDLYDAFSAAMLCASPDFQTEFGYPKDPPNGANLAYCAKQAAHRFDCLAVTVELTFKDTSANPDPVYGWSVDRTKAFGADMLTAIRDVLPVLR